MEVLIGHKQVLNGNINTPDFYLKENINKPEYMTLTLQAHESLSRRSTTLFSVRVERSSKQFLKAGDQCTMKSIVWQEKMVYEHRFFSFFYSAAAIASRAVAWLRAT